MIDDIQIYRYDGDGDISDAYRINESLDSTIYALDHPPAITEHTLTKCDFYMYIAGLLVRIQTIVLGFICFKVETENTCVVVWDVDKPLSHEMLPDNLNILPGGFANMSRVFQTIIMMLFITSVCTSIMYVNKVVNVIKYHRASV